MNHQAISLKDKLARFSDQWAPKVIAELNDYQFKLVKLEGDFLWHKHEETDEAFLCLDGEIRIELRDGHVTLRNGDLFVVPRGAEHRVLSECESSVLLIEPRGVLNTGDGNSELAADNDVWI